MLTHKRFRLLGYIYAIFGAFLTFLDAVDKIYLNVKDDSHQLVFYIAPVISFVMLIFFVILIFGIWMNNLTLVKIYRVSLHITYGCVVAFLIFVIVLGIMYKLMTENEIPFGLMPDVILTIVVFIGLYLLFLWITNGVFKAVQYEQGSPGAVFYQPESNSKEEILTILV